MQAIAYGKKAASDHRQSGSKYSATVASNRAGVAFFMGSAEEISPEEIALVRQTVLEELTPSTTKD
jgi:hypothetical protein